jgi:hypothetical protein
VLDFHVFIDLFPLLARCLSCMFLARQSSDCSNVEDGVVLPFVVSLEENE